MDARAFVRVYDVEQMFPGYLLYVFAPRAKLHEKICLTETLLSLTNSRNMATRKILRKDEQLLNKLNSILVMYKNFQHSADERDNLIIIEALVDLREILTRTYISKPLKANDVSEIELILKDLNSHVKAMALDELFEEINGIKGRLDLVEKRFELEDTRRHPKMYFRDEGEL